MRQVILIAHNIRSTHNVGAMLRTAEGLGVEHVYLTGYTPYPVSPDDNRLPHLAQKIDRQIHKTALGAERMIPWEHKIQIEPVFKMLRHRGYTIAALEQQPGSTLLPSFTAPERIALIVGREVEGIEPEILEHIDITLEIPMQGSKESFNVAAAAAMALYHLTARNDYVSSHLCPVTHVL